MSERRPGSRRLPPPVQDLLLSAATVIVVGGAAEGLCRLFERDRPAPPPVAAYITDWGGSEFATLKSAATGWPPWEDYNSDGLRDREHAVDKPRGVRRVACLGDSVTLGYGIRPQEAWPQVLEDVIDARGQRAEVFNVAFGGWSTRQELIAYRRLARKYRPDDVLLGICLNDVPEMQNNLTRPPRLVRALYRRSALVRTVVGARRREIASVEELFRQPTSAKVEDAFRLLFEDVRALKADVRADGGRLAVVVFPFRFQVVPGAPPPSAQRAIEEFCAAEGLPFLDVLPALRELGDAAFIDYDHFSPAGARRAAEAVADSGLLDLDEGAAPDRASSSPRTIAPAAGKPVPALLASLRAADPRERAAAARALGNRAAEPASAIPALVAALADSAPEVRAAAAWGLGGFGPAAAAALAALAARLGDDAPAVRAGSAWALGRIGPPARSAAPAVVSLLDDEDESVRWRAGEALAAVGPDPTTCLDNLRRMAADPGHRGRAEAAEALGQLGPAAAPAVPELVSALGDARSAVRARAAAALGRIGPAAAPAVPALVRMIGDPDNGWRAVDALGGIGPDAGAAVGALTDALTQPSGSIRWRAAQALGRLGESASAAAPALVRALVDAEDNVRLASARALTRVRADPALVRAPLLRALADPDSRVRAAAARALRRLGPDAATERALEERARSDPDETVRAEARHALKPAGPSR
ncbi:MAG TPA: HEAT repeat domain-containing protein [Vicinamibacteria bacterium]